MSRKIGERAKATKRKREQELRAITHQLRSPLYAIIGALSGIKREPLEDATREMLDLARAIVEDAHDLCYGTLTAFALEAGQDTAFGIDRIDAPSEIRKICNRLQKTSRDSRHPLSFSYKEAHDFPALQMDRHVFTSVLYSLIHNAIKYADQNSEIFLECRLNSRKTEAHLKVKSVGEPIRPREADLIFEKFRQGRIIARGRHHDGLGLGLWVARKLMHATGGNLTVKISTEQPRLSVFIMHIPLTHE